MAATIWYSTPSGDLINLGRCSMILEEWHDTAEGTVPALTFVLTDEPNVTVAFGHQEERDKEARRIRKAIDAIGVVL